MLTTIGAPITHLAGKLLFFCGKSRVLFLQLLNARELSTPIAAAQRMLGFQGSQLLLDPKQSQPSVLLELAPSGHDKH